MKRSLLVVVLAALAACSPSAGSREAPELVLPDLAGNTVRLADLKGRPVLVNFWATWCDSCREEMPALETLSRRLPEARFLAVSVDDDPAKAVPPFAKAYRLTVRQLAGDRRAMASFGVTGLPTAFLIDPEGRVARRWVGELDAAAVENDIKALLSRRGS